MVYDFFNMLLHSVCQNFVKIFASMFISDIGLQFFFFVASLSGFGIKVMVASQNAFGSLPSSAIFWKSLSKELFFSLPGCLGHFSSRILSFQFQRLRCFEGAQFFCEVLCTSRSLPFLGCCPSESQTIRKQITKERGYWFSFAQRVLDSTHCPCSLAGFQNLFNLSAPPAEIGKCFHGKINLNHWLTSLIFFLFPETGPISLYYLISSGMPSNRLTPTPIWFSNCPKQEILTELSVLLLAEM